MPRLEGKAALISGGARGQGAADVSSQGASADERSQSSSPALTLPPEMTFSTLPPMKPDAARTYLSSLLLA